MARCAVCERSEDEVPLFNGIYDGSVRKICYRCATMENITMIKKPTAEQLAEAERRRSVKEVMENISSPQKKIMAKEQMLAHKGLAKLRFPSMKQEHGDLLANYDWILKQARRHEKISTTQLAQQIGVARNEIESLEAGQLFVGFQKVARKLESALGVRILSVPIKEAESIRDRAERKNVERRVLDSVKEKMKKHSYLVENRNKNIELGEEVRTQYENIDENELVLEKKAEKEKKLKELSDEISSGKFDFSRRENLNKISLQDLTELKKLKDEKKKLEKNE